MASFTLGTCPVCDRPAVVDVDPQDASTWTTCRSWCREVFVTPAHLNNPTMRYPLPEDEAEYDAIRRDVLRQDDRG